MSKKPILLVKNRSCHLATTIFVFKHSRKKFFYNYFLIVIRSFRFYCEKRAKWLFQRIVSSRGVNKNMKTDKQYESYNELIFMLYSKTSIDNAVIKEEQRKYARAKWQLSMSALTDSVLCALANDSGIEHLHEDSYHTFNVHGVDIPVFHEGLAKAISSLLATDREIILLYYFLGMTDDRIAKTLRLSHTTINRRRLDATDKLRDFLEERK